MIIIDTIPGEEIGNDVMESNGANQGTGTSPHFVFLNITSTAILNIAYKKIKIYQLLSRKTQN